MLVECLVYCALVCVIFGLAYGTYFRAQDGSRALQRNAIDISRALDAGERWREDIRLAHIVSVSGDSLKLTQPSGVVEYTFSRGAIWRRAGSGPTVRLLSGVMDSYMQPDPRSQVKAWKWELELVSQKKKAKVTPLFTFLAVPKTTDKP